MRISDWSSDVCSSDLQTLGGDFDPESTNFALVLENLTARDARFPNVTQKITTDNVRPLLDTLASLHARFWQSPRFESDLKWVETHVSSGVAAIMNGVAPTSPHKNIYGKNFKSSTLQRTPPKNA